MYLPPVYQISTGSRTHLRNSIVSEKAGQETADPAARLYKLSSIRSFRFPVGSRAHRHTHTHTWARLKLNEGYILCRPFVTGKLGRDSWLDSRGKVVVAAGSLSRVPRGIRIRRQEEGGWKFSGRALAPFPPLVAVQIRSDLPPN